MRTKVRTHQSGIRTHQSSGVGRSALCVDERAAPRSASTRADAVAPGLAASGLYGCVEGVQIVGNLGNHRREVRRDQAIPAQEGAPLGLLLGICGE